MAGKAECMCVDVGGVCIDCLVMEEAGLLRKLKASTILSDPSKGSWAA